MTTSRHGRICRSRLTTFGWKVCRLTWSRSPLGGRPMRTGSCMMRRRATGAKCHGILCQTRRLGARTSTRRSHILRKVQRSGIWTFLPRDRCRRYMWTSDRKLLSSMSCESRPRLRRSMLRRRWWRLLMDTAASRRMLARIECRRQVPCRPSTDSHRRHKNDRRRSPMTQPQLQFANLLRRLPQCRPPRQIPAISRRSCEHWNRARRSSRR